MRDLQSGRRNIEPKHRASKATVATKRSGERVSGMLAARTVLVALKTSSNSISAMDDWRPQLVFVSSIAPAKSPSCTVGLGRTSRKRLCSDTLEHHSSIHQRGTCNLNVTMHGLCRHVHITRCSGRKMRCYAPPGAGGSGIVNPASLSCGTVNPAACSSSTDVKPAFLSSVRP